MPIYNPLPWPFFNLDGSTHPAFHVYAFGVADYNLVKAIQADAKVHSANFKQDNTLSVCMYVFPRYFQAISHIQNI